MGMEMQHIPAILLSLCVGVEAFSVMPICSQSSFLKPRPQRLSGLGERWPVTTYTRQDAKDNRRLEGRILRVESLVHDLCCAIVYCDDMALMEREMLQAGDIHLDLSSTQTRDPLLLRRAVADIAWRYGRPVSPPEHKWH